MGDLLVNLDGAVDDVEDAPSAPAEKTLSKHEDGETQNKKQENEGKEQNDIEVKCLKKRQRTSEKTAQKSLEHVYESRARDVPREVCTRHQPGEAGIDDRRAQDQGEELERELDR